MAGRPKVEILKRLLALFRQLPVFARHTAERASESWARFAATPRNKSRWAAHALPLVAAVASLGFEHAEAGILRTRPSVNDVSRATASELALRGAGLRRARRVSDYAIRYKIDWSLAARIYDAARAARVEPRLAYRLVRVESSFRQRVIGPAGSIGYTQVQPNTARWLDPMITRDDLFEAETNLKLGFRYLRLLIDRYGDTRIALLAYNRGPGTVEALLMDGEDPANGYAGLVLGKMR